jgi:tetratricopeptide (TPR) repeat protein
MDELKQVSKGMKRGTEEDMMRSFDEHGHMYLLPKSIYRQQVLPGIFAEARDSPHELFAALVIALEAGFFPESLPYARRLFEIDPVAERGTTILGIALMKNGLLDEAGSVLQTYLDQHGASATILTNLAKIYDERGQHDRAYDLLWQALSLDPNLDNGLAWWGAIHQDKDGDIGFYRAMQKVASISGSWRPQLWLARMYLEHGDLIRAKAYYAPILSMPHVPADAMMMISGDLGKNGFPSEVLQLVSPIYNAREHGIIAGINVVSAYIETKQPYVAMDVLRQLYELERYDMKSALDRLREEIVRLW